MVKYVWTPEKDELVRRRYDGRVRGRAAEIARILGWPAWLIKKRAGALGVTRPVDRRPWTAAEEAKLWEWAGSRTTQWMAQRLRRSEASVILKFRRMQISRRWREGYTLHEVALCFGCDHRGVDQWIRAGKLTGRRRGTRRQAAGGRPLGRGGGPADPWVFTDADLLRFIAEHPMIFRLDKVDQLWFMDLISQGGLLKRALAALEADDKGFEETG